VNMVMNLGVLSGEFFDQLSKDTAPLSLLNLLAIKYNLCKSSHLISLSVNKSDENIMLT
jgi:hypothetical protein